MGVTDQTDRNVDSGKGREGITPGDQVPRARRRWRIVDAHHRMSQVRHARQGGQSLEKIWTIPPEATPCPRDRFAGHIAESRGDLRTEDGFLVVAKDHDDVTVEQEIQTCFGFRSVADHITETDQTVDASCIEFVQDGFECEAIAMDVAEDAQSHATASIVARNQTRVTPPRTRSRGYSYASTDEDGEVNDSLSPPFTAPCRRNKPA